MRISCRFGTVFVLNKYPGQRYISRHEKILFEIERDQKGQLNENFEMLFGTIFHRVLKMFTKFEVSKDCEFSRDMFSQL
jgi:hypothetical protein